MEKFYDGGGEIELFGALDHVFLAEGVGCHPLSKVADNLGGWCDFDDIATLREKYMREFPFETAMQDD